MESFEIKSQSLTTTYEYTNDDLVVNGNYASNKAETEVQHIDGSAYAKADGEGRGAYIGNFTGIMTDGEMEYSMSKMSRRNANLVWDAIDGIEAHVLNGDANGEGGEA